MTVRLDGKIIRLEGACSVEDAEILLGCLQAGSGQTVDLTGCGRVHTAVLQILLAAKPPIQGVPVDPFTRDWLLPMLQENRIKTKTLN